MKNLLIILTLLIALAVGALWPMRTESAAQFIDRIVRPCSAGAVPLANVTVNPNGNGNVNVVPCTGGSLTVNGVAVGSNAFNSTAYMPLTGGTFTGDVTHSGAAIILSGNISGPGIYGTTGIRVKGIAATFTDTTSSGTIPTAYNDVLGGSTWAASGATTITNAFALYLNAPVQGTNVTLTNKWALGADSAKFGTSNQVTISTTGVLTATSPVFITPVLGTPASGVLTNATGLPVSTGISGFGANVATFLATPSSANFFAAITDETGSGLVVGATQPQFTTGIGIGGAAGTGNTIKIFGTTSGSITFAVPAIAGSNTITFPAGTTNFSATGGASQVVKQTSSGGAFTVAQLAFSDLSGSPTVAQLPVLAGAFAYASGTQSVTDSTLTALAFDSEVYNNGGVHSTVTNNSRFTALVAGQYQINCSCNLAANAVGQRLLFIYINGTTQIARVNTLGASVAIAPSLSVSSTYKMAVNDYAECIAYQTSGGALLTTNAGNTPSGSFQFISP